MNSKIVAVTRIHSLFVWNKGIEPLFSAWNSKNDVKKWCSANNHKRQIQRQTISSFFVTKFVGLRHGAVDNCWWISNLFPIPQPPIHHCFVYHYITLHFCSTCHSKNATLISTTDRKWDNTSRKNYLRKNGPDGDKWFTIIPKSLPQQPLCGPAWTVKILLSNFCQAVSCHYR